MEGIIKNHGITRLRYYNTERRQNYKTTILKWNDHSYMEGNWSQLWYSRASSAVIRCAGSALVNLKMRSRHSKWSKVSQ